MSSVSTHGAQSLIQLESASVHKRGKAIVDKVSLTVHEEDFVTIIGPNGAGKSTLLRVMLGSEPLTSGTRHARSMTIGYVPQKFTSPSMLPLPLGVFLGLNNPHKESTGAICERLGIDACLYKQLSELSGGQMQRALLARALLRSPQLLVLDEPAQNLDIAGEIAFYSLLKELHQERTMAIVMVSHDLHMVFAASKQVVCLHHHVCCSGEPQAVTTNPTFISLFGHEYADLMAVYRHKNNDHKHAH